MEALLDLGGDKQGLKLPNCKALLTSSAPMPARPSAWYSSSTAIRGRLVVLALPPTTPRRRQPNLGIRQELDDQPLQARVNLAAKPRLPSEDASIVYEDCENLLYATNVSFCPLFALRV